MSTVTTCPAVVSSSVGWTLTGAASFDAALSDASDSSYASAGSAGTITSTFTTTFDLSAIPGTALIQSMVLTPRVGIGVTGPFDMGDVLYFFADLNGSIHNGHATYSYPGSPAIFIDPALASGTITLGGDGAPLDRADLTGLGFSLVAQASDGHITAYIYNLSLAVTWTTRSGGVL